MNIKAIHYQEISYLSNIDDKTTILTGYLGIIVVA